MLEILQQFSFTAAIDIIVIAVIIYYLLLLIRGTRAAQMLIGIIVVAALFLLSSVAPLTTLNWVLNKFYSSFIIILVILFQDDIRHMLSRVGKRSFGQANDVLSSGQILDEITRAAMSLAGKRMGGLMVIERSIILTRYVEVGVPVDGRVTKELLVSIFHPSSPIHDGAVIIQRGRVAAAGCFLPLTRDENLDPNMGTRHRAAIGISQETDAIVVAVSEETGWVSLVVEGEVTRKLDAKDLKQRLLDLLADEPEYTNPADDPPQAPGAGLLDRIKFDKLGGKR